jgi:hypothetical protein
MKDKGASVIRTMRHDLWPTDISGAMSSLGQLLKSR